MLRCPRCGADAPDDAAWCPRCGKPVELELLDLDQGDRLPAPIETGRDRRPLVVAAAVVAVLLAALLLTSGGDGGDADGETEDEAAGALPSTTETTASRTTASIVRRSTTTTLPGPIAPEPIGARLAITRDGELALVDIDGNGWTTVDVPELVAGSGQTGLVSEQVARRGDHLVFQGEGATFAAPLDDPAAVRQVAPSLLFLTAVAEDEVWVVQPQPAAPATVQRFRIDGTALTPPHPLPVDWLPFASVDGGLVLRRGGRFQVWDPASGRTSMTSEPDVSVLAARGRTVAWHVPCDVPVCAVHLTDTVTSEDRLVFVGDVQIDWGRGSFSPDGRTLVLHAHRAEDQGSWRAGLLVVDPRFATARFFELGRGDLAGGATTWSSDSRWLFLLANIGSPNRTVLAYGPRGDRLVELELPRGIRGVGVAAY